MQNRRSFLKNIALGAAAVYSRKTFSIPKFQMGLTGKNMNDNINIALIGKGGMGTADTRTALSVEGVKLVAVCDLYDRRLDEAVKQWGNDLFLTKDYKEILALKNVDAVIIATPDHWHQPIAVEAMEAGKHVYCEKPVIHKLKEGKKLIEVQKKNRVFFQVGSQGMASIGNRVAKILVNSGLIGQVNYIEGHFSSAPGELNSFVAPVDADQKTIWWDRFLGDAPKIPFNAQRFFAWRNWRDYGTTLSGDLFVHVLASVHYIMGAIGPTKVYATGGIRHYTDGSRDTPDVMLAYFDYPDRNNLGAFTLSLGANYADGISKKWGSTNFTIVGSKGTLEVGWDSVILKTIYNIDVKDFGALYQIGYGMDNPQKVGSREYVFQAEKEYKGGHYDHFYNFFSGIRENFPLTADVLFAVRSAAPALLCYESLLRNQAIYWDAELLVGKNM